MLLEFLAAVEFGKKYTGNNNDMPPDKYNKSAKLITQFLSKKFNDKINSEGRGRIYGHIRCGLVHEAGTKGNDRILSERADECIDNPGKFYFLACNSVSI